MQRITVEDLVRDFPARWLEQYPDDRDGVAAAVRAGNVTDPAEINRLVGNGSWTDLVCDECTTRRLGEVVEVGDPPDYESSTARLCLPCLRKALGMEAATANVYADFLEEQGEPAAAAKLRAMFPAAPTASRP